MGMDIVGLVLPALRIVSLTGFRQNYFALNLHLKSRVVPRLFQLFQTYALLLRTAHTPNAGKQLDASPNVRLHSERRSAHSLECRRKIPRLEDLKLNRLSFGHSVKVVTRNIQDQIGVLFGERLQHGGRIAVCMFEKPDRLIRDLGKLLERRARLFGDPGQHSSRSCFFADGGENFTCGGGQQMDRSRVLATEMGSNGRDQMGLCNIDLGQFHAVQSSKATRRKSCAHGVPIAPQTDLRDSS
jgi:hypothetical protein